MVLSAIVATLFAVPAEVKVTPETYRDWEGSYRISNGTVDLVVVPKIGRVMWFGYTGGKNLLWEDTNFSGKSPKRQEYINYGGDKLWPAPQSLWGWPPDPNIDGPAHSVEVIPNGIRMKSPVGKGISVQFTREITLDPVKAEVKFRNRMENRGTRQTLAAWQVTQIAEPDFVRMPFESAPGLPKGWHGYGEESLDARYHEVQSGGLIIRRGPEKSRKFGGFHPSGELSAQFGSTRFLSTSPVLRGQTYVDQNSPMQVYTNQNPSPYIELEHTSPVQPMLKGESVFLDVTWRLEMRGGLTG
jgi:hypothetical protein